MTYKELCCSGFSQMLSNHVEDEHSSVPGRLQRSSPYRPGYASSNQAAPTAGREQARGGAK